MLIHTCVRIAEGSFLDQFLTATKDLTPEQRAKFIEVRCVVYVLFCLHWAVLVYTRCVRCNGQVIVTKVI
jgi:hypothetical protein